MPDASAVTHVLQAFVTTSGFNFRGTGLADVGVAFALTLDAL